MKHLIPASLFLAAVTWALPAAHAADSAPLIPPAQDQALPYTRSARPAALAKIKDHIAVFAGSRYAYVQGYKTRLDPAQLRAGEATRDSDRLLVPAAFAAVLDLKNVNPPAAPDNLASRWVYDLGLKPSDGAPVDLAALARSKGLSVQLLPRGLLLIGRHELTFTAAEAALLDSVITLFDTPDKFADPDIATRAIPTLARQGKWTDHVKVTPEQLAILEGPVTDWPTTPQSAFDFTGFDARLLGSPVPAPGVYPRLLFTEADVPALAARIKSTRIGQMSLIEMKHLFTTTWWDPKTSDGQIFRKLVSGDLAGLEWDAAPGTSLSAYPQQFKGQKTGIHNSHVAYVPECLTAMAFYCLLTGDDARGREAAAAIASYFTLRERLLDQWLAISDSEFGSSSTDASGAVMPLNGAGAETHWRNLHGIAPNMNLGLSLDFAGKWMTPAERDGMRRFIAKATYGRRAYGQDAPRRFRDVNWMAWDLPNFLAVAAIEGLPGFDPEVYESGAESVRAFCDWGIDNGGVVFESNGKTPGSFQFQLLSMVALARRGDNLFGHPHWRRLLEGQIQMTSPSGRVTVNSGTQYVPHSRESLSLNLVNAFKGFYPSSRLPDYLVTKALASPGSETGEFLRGWPRANFDPALYTTQVGERKRLRLPSPSYPGFVRGVLYDGDVVPTTRADLNLPLDFDSPGQGVFSSYSDRTPDAAWINLYVRPGHYLGAGHHHADAGMFHFSALGVDWFTESPFSQLYSGNVHNLVLVDGLSEASGIEGVVNGYNAAATYLGARSTPQVAAASADLTYAYSWRWITQAPQTWSPELKALDWELDPSPQILKIFAGTARYKMRPWWTNYTYVNYTPTSRAPFNPMRRVFRTTGLVRGTHPYGVVLDDAQKDDTTRLYQWTAMLNGGVRRAQLAGLGSNQFALGYREGDADTSQTTVQPAIEPAPGEPLLLVCALGLPAQPPSAERASISIERISGLPNKKGEIPNGDRLSIDLRAPSAAFRILLLPIRAGQPLPVVTYDAAKQTAEIRRPGQIDTLQFTGGEQNPASFTVRRNGVDLLNP